MKRQETRLSQPDPPDLSDEDFPPIADRKETLPGWPGYRNRPGRSGYDPLDTDFELAHMIGVYSRLLITGKIRTRNLFILSFMALFGLASIFTLLMFILEVANGNLDALGIIVVCVPFFILGTAFLVNFIRNIRLITKKIKEKDDR